MQRKDELRAGLAEVRNRTLRLLENVSDDFLRVRVHNFYSPIGWHFGHVGRTEEYWVCQATGQEPFDKQLSFLYADLADNPKDNRVNIPHRAGTIEYLTKTRQVALDALEKADLTTNDPFLRDGYAWEFAIQHECQHHETIAEMLHLIQSKLPAESLSVVEGAVSWKPGVVSEMIEHPAGEFTMGDPSIHGYDNEKDPHMVRVEAFKLAKYPVTAFEWSEFIQDGGYRRPELWSECGRTWVQENEAEAPYYWVQRDGSYAQYGPFGLRYLHPDEPVVSISQYEAEAYAKWKGMRLPTEQEWEYAASFAGGSSKRRFAWGDEKPDETRSNHSLFNWSPQPVGAAYGGLTPLEVSDMSGNVWEWTETKFAPYPGFVAFPYDGYSKDHMLGAHFVCRGGSWATSPTILRNTFRNWYVPSYRQGFLGVRLASD